MTSSIGIYNFVWVKGYEPIVYGEAVVVAIILLYSAYVGYKRWTYGNEKIKWPSLTYIVKNFIQYVILQWKVLRKRFPGTMHALIFYGIGWLAVTTVLRAINAHVVIFLTGDVFFVYKLLANIAGIIAIIGIVIAIIRRSLKLTKNLPQDPYYYLVLGMLLVIVITGFLLSGIAAVAYRYSWESYWFDPIGYLVFLWSRTVPISELQVIYRGLWLFHMSLAMLAMALIPYTNLWHIYSATVNVSLQREGSMPDGIKPVLDIDERIEKGKPVGVVKLSDTTWKQRIDYDACTSCMRCTNACPAFNSGKILSPRNVIVDMKEMMHKGLWEENVIGTKEMQINPEAIWSCVTCGACVYECPVIIHHVDTIIDLRRGMISTSSQDIPEDALNALYRLQQTGNPLGMNPVEKEQWINELAQKYGDDIIAKEGEEYDYLYWIGCVTTYDPRIRPVAESLIKIAKLAGLRIGIPIEQGCCGEPARSIGDEALYVEYIKMNLEMLSKYKFKKLLVNCPHGFNNFKNNYKKYKDYLIKNQETAKLVETLENLKVEHHSILISRLIKEGKIKPTKELNYAITYHDPCYLGRWNNIYDEPRKVIGSIKGLRIKEMPRNRENSFCCGGGGGQMFYEVKRGERISVIRSEEAKETLDKIDSNEKVLSVSCPMCNTMFRGESDKFGFKVKDIAELVDESLEEKKS
ncbi:MAG: heterodisulfide reductase-related iron-sulfur binding cluster [Caldisphaera sp.]